MAVREIEFAAASSELRQAIHHIIIEQMAEALTAAGIDLADDTAVSTALYAAGFGASSVTALSAPAAELALSRRLR